MTDDNKTDVHANSSVRANLYDMPSTVSALPVTSFDEEENDSKNIIHTKNDYKEKEMLQKRGGLRSMPARKKIDLNHCSSNFMTSSDSISTILELKRKRDDLAEQIKVLSHQVNPIEFESYHEYFLINTFRKGISASGHVDIDNLKRKHHGRYYKRIKRGANTTTRESVSSSPASSTNSLSEEDDDNERDKQNTDDQDQYLYDGDSTIANDESKTGSKRRTRAQAAARKETKKSSPSQDTSEQIEQKLINGDISVASIIPTAKVEGTRRRSSRLNQRTNEESIAAISGSSIMSDRDEETFTNIRDLYEALVPKVKDPYRRSDWILPSKQRYTPEKQMQTKPVFEKIKINELVTSGRIRNILSKFEGGVAGVRKRG